MNGLDTVFYVLNDDGSEETSMFTDHTLTLFEVRGWVDTLRTGVPTGFNRFAAVCQYAIKNLRYSASFILASVTKKCQLELEQSLGLDATGPEILAHIYKRQHAVALSTQRNLVGSLMSLSLTAIPGESVPDLNNQIKDLCQQIESVGEAPADLNQLVLKCYLDSSVPMFATDINSKYLEILSNPDTYHWTETLRHTEELYYQLLQSHWVTNQPC